MPPRVIGSGRPFPLGAGFGPEGVNLAVQAGAADRLELCLFDAAGAVETARLALPGRSGEVHHGLVEGLAPGQVYGLRAHGPWEPAHGRRCNPAKLLLDPHARDLAGTFAWAGPNLVDPADVLNRDPRDSAPVALKGRLRPAPGLAAQGPATGRPGTPWGRTVVYEAHVKSLTRRHPAVPAGARGTYAGLAHPAVLEHLVRLGVTAVELLPVAAFLDERRLVSMGLTNHWGYNPVALLAVEPRFAPLGQDPTAAFQAMVAALHGAGLEVILDVVLNHTAETDHLGPTISLRGLDDGGYYRRREGEPARYVNHSGCGNTLDLSRPPGLTLAMDALRHFAALGVDGFRFDLAAALGRDRSDRFDPDGPFLAALRQDPDLGGLKLIAEPWDLGEGGHAVGRFPAPSAEWNDGVRDGIRRFWLQDEPLAPQLAGLLLGDAQRFEPSRRHSFANLAYVTSHDGAPVADLVAYEAKHNQANGEDNRDGNATEHGANHGIEGDTDDRAVLALRHRQIRNLLGTLFLAQGTPMLAMGDELLRSQQGNTNAYCQDNAISWCAWDGLPASADAMVGFVARLTALRAAEPGLRRARFLHGRVADAFGVPDVLWLTVAAEPMTEADWHDPLRRELACVLNGRAVADPLEVPGALLLLILHAADRLGQQTLPTLPGVAGWVRLLDTAEPGAGLGGVLPPGRAVAVEGKSLVVYRAVDLSS